MSLSGEEPKAPMSLSGEEPKAPMSLSGEEPKRAANEVGPPRITRVRAAVLVVVALAVAGALIGALWAWLAPPIHGVVALTRGGNRVRGYLGNEADHFFLGAFLLVGLVVVLAVIAAAALWQWRAHRGPLMAAALAVGSAGAAAAAAGIGAVLVKWRYGGIDVEAAPVTPEHRVHYVVEAPAVFFGHSPLQIAVSMVFPAAAAALAYAVVALSTPRDDLGAWPPVEDPVIWPRPITVDGVLPSSQ